MRLRLLLLTFTLLLGGSFFWIAATDEAPEPLPYAAAGLTERQAAAHLLNRFAYGPRPGDLDRVGAMGLETWFARQLRPDAKDKALARRLAPLKTRDLSAAEMAAQYPNPGQVMRRYARENGLARGSLDSLDQRDHRRMMREYRNENDLRPQRELIGEMIGEKILRAVYAENQLQEVLVDFWFNHFNVALQDNQARVYVPAYERDAIRPHVLGDFRALLGATARHPAMLLYLDNAQSTAAEGVATTLDARLAPHEKAGGLRGRLARRKIREGRRKMQQDQDAAMREIPEEFRPRRGINENYARELLELHTLGVEGGYTQADVESVARAFSGWAVVPPERYEEARRNVEKRGRRLGFVLEGVFLFRADAHDATEKTVLGEVFPAGGGSEEGERVLDLVAAHPATARHLARKLAVRFVSDNPPEALIDDLARVFDSTGGDLAAVMEALAYSPYFWEEAALGAKIKSPFELAVSALRALDAEVRPTRELVEWIDTMGQPLYRYQAPTGFPDAAAHWINAGTLAHRMNFAHALAAGAIDGTRFDLAADTAPATLDAALAAYAPQLIPEQPIDYAPLLAQADDAGSETALSARAVGLLLGAPAFQRR